MKQYVVDELRPDDYQKIKEYMHDHFNSSDVYHIYRIPLKDEYLTTVQAEHAECGPFYFGVELEPDRLTCELLVRSEERIRCDCIRYANEIQRNWLIQHLDSIFEQLQIIV
jgi:hypothetical protein